MVFKNFANFNFKKKKTFNVVVNCIFYEDDKHNERHTQKRG
jgi:hypothetical protein